MKMQTLLTKTKFPALALIALLFSTGIQAQKLDNVLDQFESYAELPREVAYLHLNKSVFLKGEQIGYKAYVMDKKNLKLSKETTNLYLTLEDKNGKMVKSDLLWLKEGTTHGAIDIDSLFITGEYTLKAYTNWMLNFQEPNHFEQSVLILDPNDDNGNPEDLFTPKPESVIADFLPEGGYAPVGVETVFGAVFKDRQGYGVAGVTGRVMDQYNQELTSFEVNPFGLGRFSFTPQRGSTYSVEYSIEGKIFTKAIENIRPAGTGIKLQSAGQQVMVQLTSSKVLSDRYSLSIHNGSEMKAVPVSFDNSKKALVAFKKQDLFAGINIFTVFNEQGTPILERLYFNEFGWKNPEVDIKISPAIVQDSVEVAISFAGLDESAMTSLSTAILPETSISSNSHHNLASFVHLAPHLKTPIQNAHYYFNQPNAKKWYQLDLVMMTQGWSAYNWNTIEKKAPQYLFDFEKGISVVVTDSKDQGKDYFIYPMANHGSAFAKAEDDKSSLTLDFLFPIENEKMALSQVEKKGGFVKPGLYLQFKPSAIPQINLTTTEGLPDRWQRESTSSDLPVLDIESLGTIRELEEVVVTKSQTRIRRDQIKNRTTGRVDFFEPEDPRRNMYLSYYLGNHGYVVEERPTGEFLIVARNPNTPNNPVPAIMLDDILLTDYDLLYRFRMDLIDYIEINSSGIGGGLRFGGGLIKIYTDPTRTFNYKGNATSLKTTYDIPLTFTTPTKYYTPQFESINSGSFLRYGTFYWSPNLELDKSGTATMLIPKSAVPAVDVDIQGILNGIPFSQKVNVPQTNIR